MIKQASSVVAMSLLGTGLAHAQQAGKLQWDKVDVIPVLNTELQHVSNVTYSSDDQAQIDSWLSIVAPQLTAQTEIGGHQLEVGYRLERGDYFSSEADNYTDHFAHARGDFTLDTRHAVTVSAAFEDGHDDRGRVYSNGFGNALDSPDTFKNGRLDGTYIYGAPSTAGRVELSAGYEKMDYDTRPAIDDERAADFLVFRDRDYLRYGAAFFYQVAPNTDVVLDAQRQQIRYDQTAQPGNSLDSDENTLLAGVTWQANSYTRSFAKLGYQQKRFVDAGREDFSGVAWEVGMRWSPVSYSTVSLATSANTRETNSQADYIRSRDVSLDWQHHWLERFSTRAELAYATEEFVGQATNLRDDNTTRLKLGADYAFRRWLTLGAFYQINQRDSNRELVEFDRNVVGLTAKVTL